MTAISGIQLSSRIVENTAGPVDAKMQLNTQDRLNLTTTQRWLGMLVYDTDLNVYKQLVNNHINATTLEADWSTFGVASGTNFNIGKENFNVSSGLQKEFILTNTPTTGSLVVTINGLENYEGQQFDLSGKVIIFRVDCVLSAGDTIGTRYFY